MSMIPNNTLIVIADGGKARILRNAGDESKLELVQDDSFDQESTTESTPSGSQPKESDRNEVAFAHDLAQRINHGALNHKFDHLILVADPSTLGELRKLLHKEATQRTLAEISKTWTNSPLEEITAALDELRIA